MISIRIVHHRSPLQVLNRAIVIYVWEKELGWSVLVVLARLLMAKLCLVPDLDSLVIRTRCQHGFRDGAPFEYSHLALVILQDVDSLLRHAHVPDLYLAGGVASDGKQVRIQWIKLSDTEAILTSFVCQREVFGSVADVPYFKMAIFGC